MKKCRKCNKMNEDASNFCENCGAKLYTGGKIAATIGMMALTCYFLVILYSSIGSLTSGKNHSVTIDGATANFNGVVSFFTIGILLINLLIYLLVAWLYIEKVLNPKSFIQTDTNSEASNDKHDKIKYKKYAVGNNSDSENKKIKSPTINYGEFVDKYNDK